MCTEIWNKIWLFYCESSQEKSSNQMDAVISNKLNRQYSFIEKQKKKKHK